MLKINLFILFFIFQIPNISAINTTVDTLPTNKHIVKLSLTSLYEAAPCAHFAYEHFFIKEFSVQGELGFYYQSMFYNISYASGIRSQVEFRLYPLARVSSHFLPYISGEYFYHHINIRSNADYIALQNGTIKQGTVPIALTETQFGVNSLLGLQCIIGKHVVIDAFWGLGTIHLEDKYSEAPTGFAPADPQSRSVHIALYSDFERNGFTPNWRLNLVLGLKMGYTF